MRLDQIDESARRGQRALPVLASLQHLQGNQKKPTFLPPARLSDHSPETCFINGSSSLPCKWAAYM